MAVVRKDVRDLNADYDQLRWVYRKMLEIRLFEEAACETFHQRLWKGSLHACIGQEAIAAAMGAVILYVSSITMFFAGYLLFVPVLLYMFMCVSKLSTVLISLTSIEYENTWPSIILSAFIFAWIIIVNIPML